MPTRIKWSSLLNLTELEFEPEPPKVLQVSDEMIQTIAWLTAATGFDRRLVRCTESGAILITDAWANMAVTETSEQQPASQSPVIFTATLPNNGVLVTTSTQIVKAAFVRVSGKAAEVIYLPPECLYFYPHKTYSVTINVVPDPFGTASYIGVSFFV